MSAESKKINIRVIILRFLSVLAINAFIYSGFAVLRAFIFYDEGGTAAVLLYAAVVLFVFGSGAVLAYIKKWILDRAAVKKTFKFITFMLDIREDNASDTSPALWILFVVPAAAVLIAYGGSGIGRMIFELLPAAVGYFVAVKQSRLSSARIMSGTSLFTGMAVMFICLEMPYFVERLQYLRPACFAVSYFMIFAFLIVKNQEDIERHIFSKKHIDKSVLPRNLRRFNAMAASFVFLMILLMFNLKKVVMYVLNLAKQLIQLVISLVVWLAGKLTTESPVSGDGAQGPIVYAPSQPQSPYFNLITNIIMYFIILYISYKLLFMLITRIPGAVSGLVRALKKLFRLNVSNESAVEAEYVDTTETVLPNKRPGMVKAKKKKKLRVKKLGQITDPVEKVRRMYEIILGILPAYGVVPEVSDTTREVLEKAAGLAGVKEDLSSFTDIYDRVRYGEMVPDSETLVRAEKHYSMCRVPYKDS